MATHFNWYPASTDIIVPFNARYSFPSQANKAVKMIPRLPPKNGTTFGPGNIIRLEFPAQGYVNPSNTTLSFDVQLIYSPLTGDYSIIRFQNNIQSIFSRVRLLYGSTPIEDIIDYNQIIRSLTEWTTTNENNQVTTSSISEGVGGVTFGISGILGTATSTANQYIGQVHVRKALIQGLDLSASNTGTTPVGHGSGGGPAPNAIGGVTLASHTLVTGTSSIRRYQVQLGLGLFNQDKLIPVKFMASQLAIEITLAQENECIFFQSAQTTAVSNPTYLVGNVNLIPEILEFDDAYNASFIEGLNDQGIPIKFSTWNNYKLSTGGGSTCNLQVQERSRSVKSIFALLKRDPPTISTDSHATFFATGTNGGNTSAAPCLLDFQMRIGGRYYPAQPVQCSTSAISGSSIVLPNSGCEAWVELQKALNQLGDYRTVPTASVLNWAVVPYLVSNSYPISNLSGSSTLPEFDYRDVFTQYCANGSFQVQRWEQTGASGASILTNGLVGNIPSCCFCMATDLETSNGIEISGLNAEEQNDISLIARYSTAQSSSFIFEVFTYVDAMIVLKSNNRLELIQ